MSGLDRQGYRQIAKVCNADVITSTMSSTTCPWREGWAGFEVISSEAAIGAIVAPGIRNASLISSGTALPQGTYIGGGPITKIKVSTDSTGHKVLAYKALVL